jgi:hypothetical protein
MTRKWEETDINRDRKEKDNKNSQPKKERKKDENAVRSFVERESDSSKRVTTWYEMI